MCLTICQIILFCKKNQSHTGETMWRLGRFQVRVSCRLKCLKCDSALVISQEENVFNYERDEISLTCRLPTGQEMELHESVVLKNRNIQGFVTRTLK